MLSTPKRLLFVITLILLTASPSRGEVGLIVLEPVGPLGFFTRVGHAGTYFSNICPDGSPVRMRLCRPGEQGGVVSKYAPLSAREDYDWAIVPFEEYLHGFETSGLAPMIGTLALQRAIERHSFGPLFGRALTAGATGELPEGQWRAALATRFDRTIYIYAVATTTADDAALVAAFNAAPNRSKFNFFYRNCSDQARGIFDLILPEIAGIGDRTGGVTMQTPKGLARALVERGLEHPELHLRVRRYPQIPGTFPRSRDVLFPMENTYRSLAFAPWWFFGGFREVALGSMLYHRVISPFGMLQSARDFITPRAAQLTIEQHRLRRQQDEVRQALAAAERRGAGWPALAELNARVFRRLAEIEAAKRVEFTRVEGARGAWQELRHGFRVLVQTLAQQPYVPAALQDGVAQYASEGALSKQFVNYFDAHGRFFVDADGRGPWISLPLADGDVASTGLSVSQVLTGDPRLATLVLAAVIDYNLSQSPAHREDIAYVESAVRLLRQATDVSDVSRRPSFPQHGDAERAASNSSPNER